MSISLQRQHLDSEEHLHRAMIVPYPNHPSFSYGLITPPSEMRSSLPNRDSAAPSHPNILAAPAASRYNLRKLSNVPPAPYPSVSGTFQHSYVNSYVQDRRRSLSSSTTTSSASNVTRLLSPSLDIDARDFNVGEFTAAVRSFECPSLNI